MAAQHNPSSAPNFSIDLTGQVALVTGASSGLGERFARVLAACGATVALAARRDDSLRALADDIVAAGGRAASFRLDMTDPEQVASIVGTIEAELGQITILVNNAGINDRKPALDMELDLINAVIDTNLRGPYILSCEVARRLIATGKPGRIVNVSSISAYMCTKPGRSVYSMTKQGLVRMTEVLAVEWAPHFINVNGIAPAIFRTEMTAELVSSDEVAAALPRKRVCEPSQLDSTLLFLVSPSSEAVTGTVIKVDDGQTGR